jgi:glycosyltransferase-like protein
MKTLRIALYTHSTNPRGGVVHTLELGHALARLGHEVTIHAPDPAGTGFFRGTAARHVSIKAAPAAVRSIRDLVAQRIDEIAAHIRGDSQGYDIYHAQDSINANALADCVESADISGFVRTVHHVDAYSDPQLLKWQSRGIRNARACFCVSKVWQNFLLREHECGADIVPNGVSLERYSAEPGVRDASLRAALRLGGGPVYLAIGGVESRKNTINILRGFKHVLAEYPDAQLVIAGGASLLDHSAYQHAFDAELAESGVGDHVIRTGPMADADMPALYRIADALVFPSVKEGFGLVVLEALASETPVVVSRIAPFTEYLIDSDCDFADPSDAISIGVAMIRALSDGARAAAVRARLGVAARMSWDVSAVRHLSLYEAVLGLELQHA